MAPRAALTAFALALALLGAGACGPPDRLNVLLVTLDSVRRDRVSAYGASGAHEPTTPALDRLARAGVLFENAVSTSSWTLPAHMALFTGLCDAAHGVTDNHQQLNPKIDTLAALLSRAGYATAGFYSGPNLHPAFGFERGFDVYASCGGVTIAPAAFAAEELGAFRDAHQASHRAVTSAEVLARSSAWIRAQVEAGERPFFAFVHFWDPHYDYLAPPQYAARFDPDYRGTLRGEHARESKLAWSERDRQHLLALYDGETLYTDEHLGQLLAELEALGVADDTLVVVTSDHGEELYERGRWGHQRTLFDEVVRIPLVLRLGTRLPAGARPRGQARIQDILPSVAELLDLPLRQPISGKSLVPLWSEREHEGYPQLLHLRVPYREIHLSALRTLRRKVLWDHTLASGLVFDLERDPLEARPFAFDRLAAGAAPGADELLRALDELEGLRASLPGQAQTSSLPPELERDLAGVGYLGDR